MLTPGTHIGPYEIVAPIGAGGMGEVYRARDTRLDRDVAIKILPELFIADVERLARFEREAKTLASLNHPNIAQIYGLEVAQGFSPASALIMELVDGEDLSDRIARGPIPIADALAIARQIADALEAAHERGIIHRDLKPANIKVRDDGRVKVLDFGLAKALDPSGTSNPSAMNSPTITSPATQMGVILGTAAYMAPEQAKGRFIDRRADVWAFGVVLYEMLTGRRAFDGDDVSDVLASVLKDTPSQAALPGGTPASIRRLLRRCLEKNPSKRLDSMAAARLEIDEATGNPLDFMAPEVGERISHGRAAAVTLVAALATGLIGGVAVWRVMRPAPPAVTRLSIAPMPGRTLIMETNHHDVVISRDGSRFVYWSEAPGGANEITVRPFDKYEVAVLNAGPTARGMFLSPDGDAIAFQSGIPSGLSGELHRMPMAGGSSTMLTPLDGNLRGGSWDRAGNILFATNRPSTGLFRVSANGGKAVMITTPGGAEGETDHVWPHVLPGGTHALFAVRRLGGDADIALIDLRDNTWRVLLKDGTMPRYAASGHILYAWKGMLYAAGFDLKRMAVTTDTVRVVDGVVTKDSGAADFDISDTGTLVYMPGNAAVTRYGLAWLDRQGKRTALDVEPRQYRGLRISPDGRRAAVTIEEDATLSIWVIDLQRGTLSRLTPPDFTVTGMAWSPDNTRIAFGVVGIRNSRDPAGVFEMMASGTGTPKRLTTARAGARQAPFTWTPDGRAILLLQVESPAGDIMKVEVASGIVTPVLTSPAVETAPAISPDGRWLAYASDETGRSEVYVRPYPNVADDRIVATSQGCRLPSWRKDGRELLCVDLASDPVGMTVSVAGGTLSLGTVVELARFDETGPGENPAPAPDASRFLVTTRPSVLGGANDYRVILNWTEELKARLRDVAKK